MDTPSHSPHNRKQSGQRTTVWKHQKTRRTHRDSLDTPGNKADTLREPGYTRKQVKKPRQSGHIRKQGGHAATFCRNTSQNKADTPQHSEHPRKQGEKTATVWSYQKTKRMHRHILDTPENNADTPPVSSTFTHFARWRSEHQTTCLVTLESFFATFYFSVICYSVMRIGKKYFAFYSLQIFLPVRQSLTRAVSAVHL